VWTKAPPHYRAAVPAGGGQVLRLRLSAQPSLSPESAFGVDFEELIDTRIQEADAFYATVTPPHLSADGQMVIRQAFAGMLWSKQFYYYPVNKWIHDNRLPPDCQQRVIKRNREWFHFDGADILSLPDKWEYPWFAAWDLAFHCMVLARVDIDFAKDQLRLMTN